MNKAFALATIAAALGTGIPGPDLSTGNHIKHVSRQTLDKEPGAFTWLIRPKRKAKRARIMRLRKLRGWS